ncbi:MAG: hypothetical protein FWC66_06810 [Oscillospiraceae bacterium]|nr:hypothetical protein [Oscillospiraceae bacterium]
MLTINIKFIAAELTPGLVGGEYSIAQGATVLDLLNHCASVCNTEVPEKNLQYLYPLFNSRPVRLETELTENGTLHFCRVVVGG